MTYILILTIDPDPHVDEVVNILEKKRNVSILRINTNKLSKKSCISAHFSSNIRFIINHNGSEIVLNKVNSIWFRKPYLQLKHYKEIGKDGVLEQKFKFEEWKNIYIPLLYEAEKLKIFTVSNYTSIIKAKNKPYQLFAANEIGFKIPDTIVSCDKDEIINFIKKHSDKTITKVFGDPYVEFGDIKKTFYTFKINEKQFKAFYKNKTLDYPILIQEQINKKLELRITVIGNYIFACSIDSQSHKDAKIDWRRVDPYILKHEIYELPQHIKKKCFEICKYFKLEFGAIDMAISPRGEYVFFELNPKSFSTSTSTHKPWQSKPFWYL